MGHWNLMSKFISSLLTLIALKFISISAMPQYTLEQLNLQHLQWVLANQHQLGPHAATVMDYSPWTPMTKTHPTANPPQNFQWEIPNHGTHYTKPSVHTLIPNHNFNSAQNYVKPTKQSQLKSMSSNKLANYKPKPNKYYGHYNGYPWSDNMKLELNSSPAQKFQQYNQLKTQAISQNFKHAAQPQTDQTLSPYFEQQPQEKPHKIQDTCDQKHVQSQEKERQISIKAEEPHDQNFANSQQKPNKLLVAIPLDRKPQLPATPPVLQESEKKRPQEERRPQNGQKIVKGESGKLKKPLVKIDLNKMMTNLNLICSYLLPGTFCQENNSRNHHRH